MPELLLSVYISEKVVFKYLANAKYLNGYLNVPFQLSTFSTATPFCLKLLYETSNFVLIFRHFTEH